MRQIGKGLVPTFLKDTNNKNILKALLSNIRTARTMIESREIESGVLSKFDDLGKQLSAKQGQTDKLKELMSQVMFCQTIHPELDVASKAPEILLEYVSEVEGRLVLALQQIASKEEIAELNQRNQKQI